MFIIYNLASTLRAKHGKVILLLSASFSALLIILVGYSIGGKATGASTSRSPGLAHQLSAPIVPTYPAVSCEIPCSGGGYLTCYTLEDVVERFGPPEQVYRAFHGVDTMSLASLKFLYPSKGFDFIASVADPLKGLNTAIKDYECYSPTTVGARITQRKANFTIRETYVDWADFHK